ncbi:MAG: hypothetical protein EA338_05930 [Roseinatronobacter sp.]|uniref:Uncharacterized protein n=1 Tax=Roseinatronobacter monicus TaxID=393481 RepID=A0A543KHP2_9RHOB|nr:hypothetical protein [Roseinatronobacter monicus]TQM94598.1 hypothetical protein BD293_3281 [Roseinatronobacter monicus]TVQ00076.1 MAG: hypothetical protein EA338_05930 [Roseinatronobacter sp.]
MELDASTVAALWGAVILSGVYHGVNPGMGWPLAVSAGLMEGRHGALAKAIGALAFGHLLAMLAILLPFSMMTALVRWETELRVGAGALVIAAGLYLLINRRHPRFLARVSPSRLVLWSFLAAMAHGAGLMLVPIYLGICGADLGDGGHEAARDLMGQNIASAFAVALAHTFAMTLAGGVIAAAIYFWLGLKFLSRTWFNLDLVWALSLILVGAFGIYLALYGH